MNRHFRKWIALSLLFLFVTVLTSLGQSVSASAPEYQVALPTSRPKSTSEDYAIIVNRPGEPVCAGNDYDIQVKVMKKATIEVDEAGKLAQRSARPVFYLKIEATSKDAGVGTVSPSVLAPGSEFLAGTQDSLGSGNVVFKFHANKPGTTDIWFETAIKSAKGNADYGYLSKTITVEVVRCKYVVYAYSNWIFNAPNLISVTGVFTSGEMRADPNNQDHLEGEAETVWNGFSYSDGCSHEHTFQSSTAFFIGDVKSELLKIRLNFDAVHYDSINCASTNSGDSQLTGIDLVVPVKGGTFKLDTPLLWGRESMQGWTIIAIYTVNEQ